MSDAADFTKLVPGFDFLQSLVKNAGAALPSVGQWVAPTLDPDELDKRIGELRTVQFWLEQNARMLATTIQALEVQRMTLSTLRTMNVQMGDLRDALTIRVPEAARAPATPAPPPAAPAPAAAPAAAPRRASAKPPPPRDAAPAPPAVDPMQWWGALTRQFTELATNALKDGAVAAPAASTPTAAAGEPAPAAKKVAKKAARKAAAKRRAGG